MREMELSNRVQEFKELTKRESVELTGGMPPINPMWLWRWFKVSSEESIIIIEPEAESNDVGFGGFGGGSFGGGGASGSW